MNKKTILIIEDEPTISFNFKLFCNLAIKEVQIERTSDMYDVDIVIADTLDKAWEEFQSHNVFLISLDLNLNDNKKGKETSGMAFLRELRERKKETMVIVASSESNVSNPTEALQKLKAIGYYIKSELEPEKYQKAIEAALLYQYSAELLNEFDKTGNATTLDTADNYIKKAKQFAEKADITFGNFPEDLELKFIEKNNKLDKFTKLPTNEWIESVFRRYIVRKTDWTLIRTEILNLEMIEKISASQIAPLLYTMGGQLRELIIKFKYEDAFIGNYQIDRRPIFLVIIFHNARADYARIAKWIQEEFDKNAPKFTNNYVLELMKEKPNFDNVPKLGIKAWHGDSTEFLDLHEIINSLG